MKKNIILIVAVLILAPAIFYGGYYAGKNSGSSGVSSTQDSILSKSVGASINYYFNGWPNGFGIIKQINTDGSGVVLAPQLSGGNTIEPEISTTTQFFLTNRNADGTVTRKTIGIGDLKVNDKVYFVLKIGSDGSLVLNYLSVAGGIQ